MPELSGTLLAKGLLYGLVAIDQLPEKQKLQADRNDLVHLFHLLVQDPVDRERLALEVEATTGQTIDLTDWQGRDWRL